LTRFAYLSREDSPSPAPALAHLAAKGLERGRSNSVKRKLSEGNSYAAVTAGNDRVNNMEPLNVDYDEYWITDANIRIAKVESLCDKIVTEASQQ
jgi:hypothetical protein